MFVGTFCREGGSKEVFHFAVDDQMVFNPLKHVIIDFGNKPKSGILREYFILGWVLGLDYQLQLVNVASRNSSNGSFVLLPFYFGRYFWLRNDPKQGVIF